MARINVNITARDLTRAALRSVNQGLNRVRRAGGTVRVNILTRGPSLTRLNRVRVRMNRIFGAPFRLSFRASRASLRGAGRMVRGFFRTLGSTVGGILSDGIGQGIIAGFRAAGPVGVAVLAGIIAGSLSVIGAALSGLIITALGAAFVGIGVVSAFQSKQVQKTWSRTLANIKEEFKGVGEPLIPVVDKALKRLHEMAHVAGPVLRKAFEETAPATEKFINSLMDGFESFGRAAFSPIMDAWNVFAPVFGEEWDEFMDELGNSFGRMADLVREHPTEIAAALDVVFEAIDLLVDTVTFFGKVWVFALRNAGTAVTPLIEIIRLTAVVALESFGAILAAAVKAFGWIPGVGGKLKDAQAAFTGFKDTTLSKLESMKRKARDWGASLDRANKRRTLEADISSWQAKLKKARADLKKTTSQKARAKVEANIKRLENSLASARRKLNALNGKVVTTYVDTWHRNRGYAGNSVTGARAHGGVIGAAQTGGVRNNLTLVGEAGPEIVQLPTGSRVRSNPDTRRLLSRGDRPSEAPRIFIDAAGDDLSQLLLKVLRHAIRNQGGDVQVVLGRG